MFDILDVGWFKVVELGVVYYCVEVLYNLFGDVDGVIGCLYWR